MPLWLVFALSTAVLWASYGLLSRVIAHKSASPLAFSVALGLVGGAFSLIPALWEPWAWKELTPAILLVTFVAVTLFGVYSAFEFFARKHLEASRSTTLFQLAPVVTFFASALLIGEEPTLEKAAGLALIIVGNLVALWKHGGAVSRRGLFYALTMAAALGGAYVADKVAFSNYPLPFYTALSFLAPALYSFLILLARKEPARAVIDESRKAGWKLWALGVVGAAGYYFAIKTIALTEVSRAMPVIYVSSILTALGGVLILKERGNLWQKVMGAVFAFLGVVLLQS